MTLYTVGIPLSALLLEAVLLVRSRRGALLSRFPVFYSYIAFIFCGSTLTYAVYRLRPPDYAKAFWFYFLVTLIAEFAVLAELSAHIFNPYPALRRLGLFLVLLVTSIFVLAYIGPALLASRPSSLAILGLVRRASLTKGVIILVLLGAARYFRLPLGRNVSGIMLGFILYLTSNIANFTLREVYGVERFGAAFSVIGPLSFTACLIVWTVALWGYEPDLSIERSSSRLAHSGSESVAYQMGRFNTALTRLLGR